MTRGWSDLYRRRKAAQARFGREVHDLPLVRRPIDLILARTPEGGRVLDVGAAGERLATTLASRGRRVAYEGMEPDPGAGARHRDLATVEGTFDLVACLEVLEHLPLEEVRGLLGRMGACLGATGHLVVSVPNVFRPQEQLRDATHRTPLCWDQLVGLVEEAGLEVVSVHRGHAAPVLRRFVQRRLFGWLFRLLGLDYARQIVLVARRAPETAQLEAEL